jgi:hypothetical protein
LVLCGEWAKGGKRRNEKKKKKKKKKNVAVRKNEKRQNVANGAIKIIDLNNTNRNRKITR